jgi:hypothetical protein
MKTTKLLSLSLLAVAHVAAADPKPPGRAPTDAKLAQLVGRWAGSGSLTLDGKTRAFKATLRCERAVLGPAITCALSAVLADGATYDEVHLIGHDDATGTYHLFSVNNWGEAYDHAAKWTDAAKVSWQYDVVRDGKPAREVMAYELGKSSLTLHNTFTADGKVIAEGTGTLQRVP